MQLFGGKVCFVVCTMTNCHANWFSENVIRRFVTFWMINMFESHKYRTPLWTKLSTNIVQQNNQNRKLASIHHFTSNSIDLESFFSLFILCKNSKAEIKIRYTIHTSPGRRRWLGVWLCVVFCFWLVHEAYRPPTFLLDYRGVQLYTKYVNILI